MKEKIGICITRGWRTTTLEAGTQWRRTWNPGLQHTAECERVLFPPAASDIASSQKEREMIGAAQISENQTLIWTRTLVTSWGGQKGTRRRRRVAGKGPHLIFRSVGSMRTVETYERIEHSTRLTRCDGSHEDKHVAFHATYDVCTGRVYGEYSARRARWESRNGMILPKQEARANRKVQLS